jgi:hypothetical protein
MSEAATPKPPLDQRAVFVGVLDCFVAIAQMLVNLGVVTPEQLAEVFETAAQQQAQIDQPLVDPTSRALAITTLRNVFAARIVPPIAQLN